MLPQERLVPASGGAIARPPAQAKQRDLLAWFDAVWIAVVMTSMLLVQLLETVTALIILAAVPAFVYLRRDRFRDYALAAVVIGILPAWALISALWSPVPGLTIYYGIEYLFTVMMGVIIGAALDKRQAILGMFAAFAVHAVASLIVGRYVDVGTAGSTYVEEAFVGVMISKNIAADASGLGILVSGAALVAGFRMRQPLLVLAAALVVGIDVWMVLKADSTGALIAAIIASLGMICMQPGRLLSVPARTLVLVLIMAAGTAALLLEEFWYQPVMELVLSSAGKDPSLTGRTYIWSRAAEVIAHNSALGVGYSGFWFPGNAEAEILWKFGGIVDKRGFNFHNTVIEILVHFGYTGVALFGAVFLVGALGLLIRTTRRPTEFGIFLVAYLCFVGARAPVEAFGLAPFLYSTTLISAALAYGLRRSA